jgi:hypothetical protein
MEAFKKDIEKAYQNYDEKFAAGIVLEAVKKLIEEGCPRNEIVAILNVFYDQFEEDGREKAADDILGIMDGLTGWTSPSHLI